ncbi:Calcineurin B-like protein 10 [Striga hermonthica]|uniref:Calcineurin B-like protein n=1 Tax=Striga hermonthica TaxID=68872 RepID=A0A9N7NUS1_STRHE|nr:Calcineurin B-like protein 10 [Striga hermonthica]
MGSTNSSLLGPSSEKLCAAFSPIIAVIDALIFAVSGCFECRKVGRRRKLSYGTLFGSRRNLIEELHLALFGTACGENLFLDRIFDLFDMKRNGVIGLEEFVQSLDVFHPRASMDDKIDCEANGDCYTNGMESDVALPDDTIEQMIDKTFEEADADKDGRINKEDWRSFVVRHPSLLKNMTLPYLMYVR